MSRERALALLILAVSAAFGDTVVVPNAQTTAAGNAPVAFTAGASARFQEIVGSGQFAGPITIIAAGLRAVPGMGQASFALPSFQVTLSTTQAYPNTNNGHILPSTAFTSNVGPDATVVYNAPFSASSPGCQAPGPCPFDIVIPFSVPFSYDPNKGRLLIDMVVAAPPTAVSGSLDGVSFTDSNASNVAFVFGSPSAAASGTLVLGGLVFGLQTATSTYYVPHFAFGGGWQSTLTYVNYSPQSASCQTSFFGDSGAPLSVPFGGTSSSTRIDALTAGATLHQQTAASDSSPVTSGWAVAVCSYPVKASVLYRFYNQGAAQGEAGVNATATPTTEFVTFGETNTGLALANPSTSTAVISITALNATGLALANKTVVLAPNTHTALNIGPFLGLGSFTGSVQVTSTVPIVSLALNAEAFPSFSSLPAGDLPAGTPLAPGR